MTAKRPDDASVSTHDCTAVHLQTSPLFPPGKLCIQALHHTSPLDHVFQCHNSRSNVTQNNTSGLAPKSREQPMPRRLLMNHC